MGGGSQVAARYHRNMSSAAAKALQKAAVRARRIAELDAAGAQQVDQVPEDEGRP